MPGMGKREAAKGNDQLAFALYNAAFEKEN